MGDDLIDEAASIYFFLFHLSDRSVFAFVDVVQLLFFHFTELDHFTNQVFVVDS
jgi:hypothetical protein